MKTIILFFALILIASSCTHTRNLRVDNKGIASAITPDNQ